jgi:hypothetical protein
VQLGSPQCIVGHDPLLLAALLEELVVAAPPPLPPLLLVAATPPPVLPLDAIEPLIIDPVDVELLPPLPVTSYT